MLLNILWLCPMAGFTQTESLYLENILEQVHYLEEQLLPDSILIITEDLLTQDMEYEQNDYYLQIIEIGIMSAITIGENLLVEQFLTEILKIDAFREVARYLITNFGKEISYNQIKNTFGIGSENTAKTYVEYLKEAWLVLTLQKFSYKKQESLRYRKVYNIDPAFARISGLSFSENLGRILENVVFLDLVRRSKREGYEVYYYKRLLEVDFVIYRRRKVEELLQVCLTLNNEKTKKREIKALVKAGEELSASALTIITLDEEETILEGKQQIRILRITDWLLRE